MPIYEMQCQNKECNNTFDFFGSYDESNNPQECPKCSGPSEKQVTGIGGVQFKGWFPGNNIKKTGKI